MPSKAQVFSSRRLLRQLLRFPPARRYLIGFSGGADSTALLVAMARQRDNINARIEAVHFDHGLHKDSSRWKNHCKDLCLELGVPFTSQDLGLPSDLPDLENKARKRRYQWIEDRIDHETIYLTAHNSDDRAETFLLHALRGSGIAGMASIPEIRKLGQGQVARPLLRYSHDSLLAYLERRRVRWIEDPTNQESKQDRNFIRNQVIPVLESRWPAASHSLAETSRHLHDANRLLRELLGKQLDDTSLDQRQLPVPVLGAVGETGSSHILREWLRRHHAPGVPQARLMEFLGQISRSSSQSVCAMTWAGWSVRLFRDELWLSSTPDCPRCPEKAWKGEAALELGQGLGVLELSHDGGNSGQEWRIGPRRAGTRIQLRSDGPRRKIKKVLSEQPIPPWHRMSVPVLYENGDVLAIGDWQTAPKFRAWAENHALRYRWKPELPELRDMQARCRRNAGLE